MGIQPRGIVACSFALFFLICIITAFICQAFVNPKTGEVGVFYQIDSCKDNSRNFTSATGSWNVYTLRYREQSEPAGGACAVMHSSTEAISAWLEPDDGDGYRNDAAYNPVIMLPSGSYAMIAFEVRDADDNILMPTYIVSLGPADTSTGRTDYPWEIDPDAITATFGPSAPPTGRRAQEEALEGWSGSSTGSIAVTQRKLLFGAGTAIEVSMPGDETRRSPGSRRLLKGGSSGGTSSGGGRSSTSGSGRWGSSSTVSRSSYSSSRTSYVSSSGYRYGGRSTYYVGGYGYYGGYRPYYYSYGPGAFLPMSPFYMIGYGGYGCYSCRRRTCYDCDSCTSRKSCQDEVSSQSPFNLDRYELSFTFTTPSSGSLKWPLQLKVHNMTQFLKAGTVLGGTVTSSTTSLEAYMTFYTEVADSGLQAVISALMPMGWVGFIFTLIFIVCMWKRLFKSEPRSNTARNQVDFGQASSASTNTNHVQAVAMSSAGPSYAQAYPTQAYAAQMPIATPMVQGKPVVTCVGGYPTGQPMAETTTPYTNRVMPTATAYPTAYPSQPVAYPTQSAYPTAYAYPSNPPSPPESESSVAAVDSRGKDE